MNIERRALYTSLRLSWLRDPTLEVQDWQVEDYREMPFSILFERLRENHLHLDRVSFLAYAEQVETPEELSDELTADLHLDPQTSDKVYLVVFELWRRLLTDKPCLSIFCDELDHQISIYDEGEIDNGEAIQDILANLQIILEENTDQGAEPLSVFDFVSTGCAHDVETFILDYIADQIDSSNLNYASELIDGFAEYIPNQKWFNLLRARLIAQHDPRTGQRLITKLLEDDDEADEDQLDFYLEILHFVASEGDTALFKAVYEKAVPLLEHEEDFQDLLEGCLEFQYTRDNQDKAKAVKALLDPRKKRDPEASIKQDDEAVKALSRLVP